MYIYIYIVYIYLYLVYSICSTNLLELTFCCSALSIELIVWFRPAHNVSHITFLCFKHSRSRSRSNSKSSSSRSRTSSSSSTRISNIASAALVCFPFRLLQKRPRFTWKNSRGKICLSSCYPPTPVLGTYKTTCVLNNT